MKSITPTLDVLMEVFHERERQDQKWGDDQTHPDGTGGDEAEFVAELLKRLCREAGLRDGAGDTWLKILAEEVGEAFEETDPEKLRTELLQIAAVCVCWVEDIDRRTAQ